MLSESTNGSLGTVFRQTKRSGLWIHILAWVGLFVLMLPRITAPMMVATFAYYLMVVGIFNRRRRVLHVTLMGSAILLDLGLVLVLEIQRSAINAALNYPYTGWQTAHIVASTLAVLFYLPTIVLGLKRLRNPKITPSVRLWHMRVALTAFSLRTVGFVLMFTMLSRH